ncbi:MAG TPA: hypothetical protein VHE14_06455, partial [Solirubrobacteraceae bacterium]|nr:hypothetical protein [Solirubrobacteraceae bacterium]
EEPPPNTHFVLATTEAQKIMATVVDRCHRFDFGRPTVEQLALVLRRAAEAEGIELPSEAVGLIARSATGSFRDALGALEQLVTYSGSSIELADVLSVLGVADADLLFETLDAVGEHDPRAALLAAARLAESGRDSEQFMRDLEAHARELMIVQTLGEVPRELSLTPERDQRLPAQASRLQRADVIGLLELLAAGYEALKAGADARTQLELALIKASTPEVDVSTRTLLMRLERLESQLGPDEGPQPGQSGRPERPGQPEPATRPDSDPDSEPPAGAPPLDLEAIKRFWPGVIDGIRNENKLLAALLADARPVALKGDELTVAFAEASEFLKRKAEDASNRVAVGEALRALAGRPLRLAYELRARLDGEGDRAEPALSPDELVARLKQEFDAEELELPAAEHPPAQSTNERSA